MYHLFYIYKEPLVKYRKHKKNVRIIETEVNKKHKH